MRGEAPQARKKRARLLRARGCGELLRALLAATVAVTVSSSIFRRVLSFTCAGDPSQKLFCDILGAQVIDTKEWNILTM